jgi:cellulose synthase/poly-beta-1,6-N-acetylglucosamine synthase-like glycosyltransferase
MLYGPGSFLYPIFILIAWVLMIYTLNFYYLAYQSRNNHKHEKARRAKLALPGSLPPVTVQLPLYNEKYVARRLIDAVCGMDYPKDRLQVQVLDDSDDDTVDLIASIVREYRLKGFDIVHLHRTDRSGYKAGALKAGMKSATGEFVAIFDADFIPPSWFIKKAIGQFADPAVGLVQCKWGHVNEDYSTMTEAQAVSLDLHFLVEQKAKSLTHIFMNFNGTAGIWRASCIGDSGGWHTSTLVEDLDLSYRAQMKGWKCVFLDDIVVDAELPVQMNAAKRQQFRWAKGSIQVALKLMGDVMMNRKIPVDTKAQAFIQMTRHIVNPLSLAQFLIFPMLLAMNYRLYDVAWAPLAVWGLYLAMGPGGYLLVINRVWKKGWRRKARQFMFLTFFASGLTVNNSVAVFDAVFGRKNEFLRTPKFGIVKKGEDWRNKEYVLPFTKTTLLEIFFGIYGIIAIFITIFSNNAFFAPLIAMQTIGFIYVAYLSITHSQFGKKKRGAKVAGPAAPRFTRQKMLLPGIIAFLVVGAGLAYYGYYSTIYPIQEAVGFFARADSAQTPQQLAEYIRLAQQTMPVEGNPVWLFPTVRTDFGVMQEQIGNILARAQSLSLLEPHTEEYNSAMMDMHSSALTLQQNLREAIPYVYISPSNIVLSGAWVAVILSVFAVMRRAGARHERAETTPALKS